MEKKTFRFEVKLGQFVKSISMNKSSTAFNGLSIKSDLDQKS